MKKSTLVSSGLLALTLSLFTFNAMPVFADETPGCCGSGMMLASKDEPKHEEAPAKTKIPKELCYVWIAVADHQKKLHEVVKTNKLVDVHYHAFAIRDLVAAMPAKSGSLTDDKKVTLTKSSSRVASLASLLDEAGDGGDSVKVVTLTGKLDGELKAIEGFYSPADLKPPKASTDTANQIYACPMHPEVTSDKPGKCPKCGMNLVLKDSGKK